MGGMEKGLFRAAVRDLMPRELNERRKSPYPKTCSPIYTEIVRGMTAAHAGRPRRAHPRMDRRRRACAPSRNRRWIPRRRRGSAS